MENPKINCFPEPCQCCECKGILCMLYHVGHSHRIEEFERSILNALEQNKEPLQIPHPKFEDYE